MIIEFQISASAFLAAQLNNLQSQQICSPPPFSAGGFQIVVDHVAFGANSIRNSAPMTAYIFFEQAIFGTESQAVNGLQVQLAQAVTAFLADQNDILAHPNQPPSLLIPIQGTIVVNINYFVSSNSDCFLNFTFDHLELGTLPPLPPGVDPKTIQQQAQSLAQQLVPTQTISLNLVQLVLGAGAQVGNAGVSVDAGLTRIAFRAETLTASALTPQIWQSFLNGNVPDRLQGSDWGVFLDHNVISSVVALPIEENVSSTSKFELVTGIGSSYSNPAPDRAHVQVTFSGNVDATICTVWTDIFIDTDITVSAPNTLTVDMNLSWNTETTACTITAAILGAVFGGLVDMVMPFVSAIINPITGFFAGIALVLYLKNTLGPPSHQAPNCTQISDTHSICTQHMAVAGSTQFGKLAFTSLKALDDGVSLVGPLQQPALTAAVIQPSFLPFGLLGPAVSCGEISGSEVQDFLKNPTAFVSAEASVTLDNGGTAPLFLCNVAVQNDSLGVFQNGVSVTNSQSPIIIDIGIRYPNPAYFANPYPCELLVSTNGGIRLISIPPVPVLTQQAINNMANSLAAQIGDCAKLVDPWFNLFHQFNPAWSPDPPPDSIVDHSWDFVVNGLQPGETATLVDSQDQALVVATAQAGTPTRVNALVSPAAAGVVEVGLIHGQAGGGARATIGLPVPPPLPPPPPVPAQRGIGLVQTLLVRRGVIPLARPAARLGSCRVVQSGGLFVVFEDGVELYDLSVSSQPRLTNAWSFPARGAIASRQGLLGFGDDGFWRLSSNGAQREPAECCEARRIGDAASGLGLIYALGNGQLQVYSPYLRLIGFQPLAGAVRLARVGNRLFAAGASGLSVFGLGNPDSPVLIDHSLTAPLIDLAVPADSGGRTLLTVSANGPALLLDISSDGPPKPIAQYPQTPWFLDTARLPGLLLRLVDGRTSITVSEFGKAQTS